MRALALAVLLAPGAAALPVDVDVGPGDLEPHLSGYNEVTVTDPEPPSREGRLARVTAPAASRLPGVELQTAHEGPVDVAATTTPDPRAREDPPTVAPVDPAERETDAVAPARPPAAEAEASPRSVPAPRETPPWPTPAAGEAPPVVPARVGSAEAALPPATGLVASRTAAGAAVGAAALVVVRLFSHLTRHGAAAHPKRTQILGILAERPGSTAADLARAVGVHLTTALYHLRVLQGHGLVRSEGGAATRWSLPGVRFDASQLALGNAERRRAVADVVREAPGLGTSEVARRAGTTPQLAHYHLDRLARAGEVVRGPTGWVPNALGKI